MTFAVNDRVRRIEHAGENNNHTTTATVIEVAEDSLGLNYDERAEPGVVHGWWPLTALVAEGD